MATMVKCELPFCRSQKYAETKAYFGAEDKSFYKQHIDNLKRLWTVCSLKENYVDEFVVVIAPKTIRPNITENYFVIFRPTLNILRIGVSTARVPRHYYSSRQHCAPHMTHGMVFQTWSVCSSVCVRSRTGAQHRRTCSP